MLKVISPVLALVGIPMSIWYLGEYGEMWGLLYCWFCLFILFWWYLANIVFRPASKKERRNLAYKRVTKKKAAAKDDQFQNNTVSE